MTDRRPSPKLWLDATWRVLARADSWLDEPAVEFWVCVMLMLLAPLMRLGFAQIAHWLTALPLVSFAPSA